jgi:hypothetical protein
VLGGKKKVWHGVWGWRAPGTFSLVAYSRLSLVIGYC